MKSNIFSEWREMPEGWKLLAQIDESAYYEVDITEIYLDTVKNKYILVTASGCSCWSGEYETEEYEKLEDIEKFFLTRGDNYTHNPTIQGAKELVVEAKKNI